MLRLGMFGAALVLLSIVSCGSSDDSSLGGSGGAAGSTATGGSNSGGTSSGGSAGSTATGGAAGSSGGTTSSGGSAGSTATGGAAGSGGSAGGTGVTFLNQGTCPSTAPTAGSTCDVTAMCCYEASGSAFVCTKSIVGVDGGAPPGMWKTVPNKTCCPAAEPTLGESCAVPGIIGCCYGSNGYRCGGPQNPDKWVAATGC